MSARPSLDPRSGASERSGVSLTFLTCAFITSVSALTSAGFSVAALFSQGNEHLNAMYASVRSLTLVVILLLVLIRRSGVALAVMAITMTLVQGGDAIVGLINHDLLKTLGPLFLAVVTVAASLPHLRSIRTNNNL
jgi:hypothetical protein